jgi:hypothetical protein
MEYDEQVNARVGEQDHKPVKKDWETPELTVHGDIVELTQQKQVGSADGATFLGIDIGSV